jgi:hypothetical protein
MAMNKGFVAKDSLKGGDTQSSTETNFLVIKDPILRRARDITSFIAPSL